MSDDYIHFKIVELLLSNSNVGMWHHDRGWAVDSGAYYLTQAG